MKCIDDKPIPKTNLSSGGHTPIQNTSGKTKLQYKLRFTKLRQKLEFGPIFFNYKNFIQAPTKTGI